MARSVRIEYAGAYYHVMARGNRREAIFLDEDDRKFFLATLGECCGRTGWRIHAWVLMENHYHLFVETPAANLVAGMKWLQNTVTRRFNVRHRQWGRLFGDRYKAVLVEGTNASYYSKLWDYIHLNAVRAGLVNVSEGGSVLDYPWSSIAGGYAQMPEKRAKWVAAEAGMGVMGYTDDAEGRRKMVEHLDNRAREEGKESGLEPLSESFDARMSHLRRGWYWGSQEFAERMRKISESLIKKGKSRGYARSPERVAHGWAEAERLVKEGLVAAGLKKSKLESLPASDSRKVALARMIWKRTTVPQAWIADKLKMGNAARVSLLLHRKKEKLDELPSELQKMITDLQAGAC